MRSASVSVGAMALLVCGCSGDSPSTDETRVCTTVQQMVDDLTAARNLEAIQTLGDLQAALAMTTNPDLSAAGDAFFADLFTEVDYRQVTLEQAAELGRQYLDDASRSLGRVIDECNAAGADIERLPS